MIVWNYFQHITCVFICLIAKCSPVTFCTHGKTMGEFTYSILHLSVMKSHRKAGSIPRLQDAASPPNLKLHVTCMFIRDVFLKLSWKFTVSAERKHVHSFILLYAIFSILFELFMDLVEVSNVTKFIFSYWSSSVYLMVTLPVSCLEWPVNILFYRLCQLLC